MTIERTLRTGWLFQLQPVECHGGMEASSEGCELCATMNALHAASNCLRERKVDMAGWRAWVA